MTVYYSIKTKGLYPDDIDYPSKPDDLVEMSDDDYKNFINPPEGYFQVFDENGPRIEALS